MTTSPKRSVDPSDIGGALRDFSSTATGITAFATGGQTDAVPLTAAYNRVTTVATTADSVKLPVAVQGATIVAVNRGAQSMNVFPATGQSINALSANAALAVAAGASARFVCIAPGIWDAI